MWFCGSVVIGAGVCMSTPPVLFDLAATCWPRFDGGSGGSCASGRSVEPRMRWIETRWTEDLFGHCRGEVKGVTSSLQAVVPSTCSSRPGWWSGGLVDLCDG